MSLKFATFAPAMKTTDKILKEILLPNDDNWEITSPSQRHSKGNGDEGQQWKGRANERVNTGDKNHRKRLCYSQEI